MERPQGVVCFNDRYLLVNSSSSRIWIQDINTGMFSKATGGYNISLETYDDMYVKHLTLDYRFWNMITYYLSVA